MSGSALRELPIPPVGTRWVGTGDVVVAVPHGWGTETAFCSTPQPRTVHFVVPIPAAARCAQTLQATPSVLSIYGPGTGNRPQTPLPRTLTSSGVEVRSGTVGCRASSVGPCSLSFAVPELGTAFHIHYRGDDPSRFVRAVRGSVTRLPDGLTTVPVVEYGTSSDRARRLLDRAGLVGDVPEVDFPHYATGTVPPAGSPVAEGATVGVTVGDG